MVILPQDRGVREKPYGTFAAALERLRRARAVWGLPAAGRGRFGDGLGNYSDGMKRKGLCCYAVNVTTHALARRALTPGSHNMIIYLLLLKGRS